MNEHVPPTVVLDTHVWFWLELGNSRVKDSKSLSLVESARRRGGVIVSAMSVWEIAMLESKNRISLHQDCHLWIRNALAAPGVILQPLSPEIAVESTRLPGDFHGDPADRILVATSRVLNAPLVTADARILAYGSRKHVRTVAV
jgi:PIN domain nuclease of toxin-antitoxin system